MAEKYSNSIYTLIGKYLSGEASLDEKSSLLRWMDESSENRSEFERMKKLWLHASHKKEEESLNVDVDLAWKKVQDKIEAEDNKIKDISSSYYKPKLRNILLKIAAFFVLAFTVYILFKLSSGILFQQQNTLASSEHILTDSLPDNSIITLNKNSNLSYNKGFKGKSRKVELQGEAFFKVSPDPTKEFVVQLKDVQVIVLGTSFNVSAYDSLKYIQVAVEEGRVKVLTKNDSSLLLGGESIYIDKSSGKLSEKSSFKHELLFWKSNRLVFKNQALKDVFEILEKQYDIYIQLSNPSILNCRLTAKFNDEKIEQIIEIIAANFKLKLERNGKTYLLDGDGCE